MARRPKDEEGIYSLLSDLVEAATGRFPWVAPAVVLASLTIGLTVYYGLHDLNVLIRQFVVLMSVIIAVTALGITFKVTKDRTGRRQRLDGVRSVHDLYAMRWQDFEKLVSDAFRARGFRVHEVGGDGTPDGGVDLEMTDPAGVNYLVQCKQWQTWSVGEPKIREFFGVMCHRGNGYKGIFVSCGRYTAPAKSFAAGKPIELIDGPALVQLIAQGRSNSTVTAGDDGVEVNVPAGQTDSKPMCIRCRVPMIRRTARQGPNAGQEFWGCTNYPKCRQIRPLQGV